MRSRSSRERTRARTTCAASSRSATTGTSSSAKNSPIAGEGAETTGVPEAVISKMRRAHIDELVTTEFTLRNTLYALYAVSIRWYSSEPTTRSARAPGNW